MKRLIVNADDFGFTRSVNEGIVEAHRNGILTAATLMANGPAFEHAVRLAKANPALDVGCHLVLVQGPALPDSVPEFLWRIARRKIDVYSEMRGQIEKILEAGIVPTHLDSHKHTHLAPPVLKAVARLSKEFGIRWVRRPFDFPITGIPAPLSVRAASFVIDLARKRSLRVLQAAGCRTTDHFAGFQLTGRLRTPDLLRVISILPDGLTEFMCHPGFYSDELRTARTRLKQSREEELRALIDPQVREALKNRGAELANYRQPYNDSD
ncbi:MAG: ChbG/HpnK family deacetylase [Acidobacteriota bacterium]|nr:ChbG/HpnK family deacetylase [Acidobacteriota bacterium]